jgi:hypothetical protein
MLHVSAKNQPENAKKLKIAKGSEQGDRRSRHSVVLRSSRCSTTGLGGGRKQSPFNLLLFFNIALVF